MRPGLPDPLLDLLGARWSMGAPVAGCAWFEGGSAVAFGLADGTLAIARAGWEGAARVQPREGGGVELLPATAAPPPVMRAGVHAGPCLAIASAGSDRVVSGGADGRFAATGIDGSMQVLASRAGARVEQVAAGRDGALACATEASVQRFGPSAAVLALPGPVTALAFGGAGPELAIAHQDGVTLWSVASRTLKRAGTHRALAWSTDGRHLVSGLQENALHGWRMPEGANIELGPSAAPPLSLAFSATGGFFAVSGGPRVVCWQLDGGIARRSEGGVPSSVAVSRVACHPRRPLIAAGYQNGAVLLCQRDSTEILFVRAAGGGAVSALAWSADGGHLAVGVEGGEIGAVALPDRLFRAVATDRTPATAEQDPAA